MITECQPNSFNPTAGSTTCTACPVGSTSSYGATTCACLSGYASTGTAASLTCTGQWAHVRTRHQPAFRPLTTFGKLGCFGFGSAPACFAGTYTTNNGPCVGACPLGGTYRSQWPPYLTPFSPAFPKNSQRAWLARSALRSQPPARRARATAPATPAPPRARATRALAQRRPASRCSAPVRGKG